MHRDPPARVSSQQLGRIDAGVHRPEDVDLVFDVVGIGLFHEHVERNRTVIGRLKFVAVVVVEELQSALARGLAPLIEVGGRLTSLIDREGALVRNPRDADVLHAQRFGFVQHPFDVVAETFVARMHRGGVQSRVVELLTKCFGSQPVRAGQLDFLESGAAHPGQRAGDVLAHGLPDAVELQTQGSGEIALERKRVICSVGYGRRILTHVGRLIRRASGRCDGYREQGHARKNGKACHDSNQNGGSGAECRPVARPRSREYNQFRSFTHDMRTTILPLLIGLCLLAGCEGANDTSVESATSDSGGFVTMLGEDTLAVERFRAAGDGMTALVVLRTPRTTVREYELQLDESGRLALYQAETRAPEDTSVSRREVVTPVGDSLLVEITEDGETSARVIAGGADALPFIDMVHWPFDLMLTRARASGADSVGQPLFTARGVSTFVVEDLRDDSMTVTHPFRGTMNVDVDEEGRLVRLDAGTTTSKLVVQRVDDVDVEALARRFAAADAGGRSFGPLSGRGSATVEIDGADVEVDYGQPSKRGREIFGNLVAWGELWRTGANQATHFETSRDLDLGGLHVPAGRYTLYTIPEADGGHLIVNRQTGQGGTTYDEEQDLGRVDMQISELSDVVEDFTILVDDTDEGGVLRLRWDRTEFSVPFTVDG